MPNKKIVKKGKHIANSATNRGDKGCDRENKKSAPAASSSHQSSHQSSHHKKHVSSSSSNNNIHKKEKVSIRHHGKVERPGRSGLERSDGRERTAPRSLKKGGSKSKTSTTGTIKHSELSQSSRKVMAVSSRDVGGGRKDRRENYKDHKEHKGGDHKGGGVEQRPAGVDPTKTKSAKSAHAGEYSRDKDSRDSRDSRDKERNDKTSRISSSFKGADKAHKGVSKVASTSPAESGGERASSSVDVVDETSSSVAVSSAAALIAEDSMSMKNPMLAGGGGARSKAVGKVAAELEEKNKTSSLDSSTVLSIVSESKKGEGTRKVSDLVDTDEVCDSTGEEVDTEVDVDAAVGPISVSTAKGSGNVTAKELEEKIIEEIEALSEDYNIEEIRAVIREIDFFNNTDSDECLEKFCENLQTTLGYCRQHYIKNWKVIRKKRAILKDGRLQQFIEELIAKYPPKHVEAIMKDLSGDKEFYQVLKELNIDTGQFDDDLIDMDVDDDLAIETKVITGIRGVNYEDDEVL
ncbi:MAG: hypothetical protein HQK53_09190 [Oligoflexia bacterium]|nr:hypothetical protein [Oligoflexia bacterium]